MFTGKEPDTLEEAKQDLEKCLYSQGSYFYSYKEYLMTSLMLIFCCCCKRRHFYKKRQKRYRRHNDAQEQLAKETDFFNFLNLKRMN